MILTGWFAVWVVLFILLFILVYISDEGDFASSFGVASLFSALLFFLNLIFCESFIGEKQMSKEILPVYKVKEDCLVFYDTPLIEGKSDQELSEHEQTIYLKSEYNIDNRHKLQVVKISYRQNFLGGYYMNETYDCRLPPTESKDVTIDMMLLEQ